MAEWKTVSTNSAPFFKFKATSEGPHTGPELTFKIIGKRQAPGLEAGKMQDVLDVVAVADGKEQEYSIGVTAGLRPLLKEPLGTLAKVKRTGTKKVPGKPSPMITFDIKTAKAE